MKKYLLAMWKKDKPLLKPVFNMGRVFLLIHFFLCHHLINMASPGFLVIHPLLCLEN